MPGLSARPCTKSGCTALSFDGSGRCPAHQRHQQYSKERRARGDPHDRMYHTGRWQALRTQVLREEPLCRSCHALGRVELATVVDHITPVKQDGDPWSRSNLQPLCRACHEKKSRAEGSRYGFG